MMSFCKKSVHSLLGLSNIPMNNLDNSDLKFKSSSSSPSSSPISSGGGGGGGGGGGIGLITATGDSNKTSPNVLESASVLIRSTSCPLPPVKRDPGGIGFIDDVGGGVDGLMSCTESLGFESCDERRVDDEIQINCSTAPPPPTRSNSNSSSSSSSSSSSRCRISKVCGRRREVKKFPPPLSSLNHNGQPSFFLQPVRTDGRLELMEVRIDRPEILRASRQDGRLRLHLIRDDFVEENQVELDREIKENEVLEELEEERIEEEEEEEEEESVKEEEERNEEWRFPVAGEGLMRCHEAVVHHHDYHRHHHHQHNNHHHNLHVWSQHCVTTS